MKLKNKLLKKSIFLLLISSILCSCTVSDESSSKAESVESALGVSENDSEFESETESSNLSVEEESGEASEISVEISEDATSVEEESSDITEISEESSQSENNSSDTESSEEEDYPYVEPSVTIDSAGERFADKFTDGEIIQTETSYQSANVNVTLKEITFGGKLFFVQDIYIKNIESFSAGFAGLKLGAKYNDFVFDMVEDYRNAGYNVIGAVNGDYCGINGVKNLKGAIIRNGKLYGTGKAEYTVCVLYKNGHMRTIPKNRFNAELEIERGAWQAWDFGPSFLAEDGSALTSFTERKSISGSGNPRTAIGYYEPGHYCFITAGGRTTSQKYGVSFKQMSAFAESLGCNLAYNLDGGESAVMVFGNDIVNEEYQGTGRRNSDIVFIMDIQ